MVALQFLLKFHSQNGFKVRTSYSCRDFLDELPNFYVDIVSELEKFPARFTEVLESDVEKLIEGEENANTKTTTFYNSKSVKDFW